MRDSWANAANLIMQAKKDMHVILDTTIAIWDTHDTSHFSTALRSF